MSNNKRIAVIVAGSRSFNDLALLTATLNRLLINYDRENITIISSGARGADRLAELYAHKHNIAFALFPGNQARYVLDKDVAQVVDILAAYFDGCSLGTNHIIKTVRIPGKAIRIVRF